jgi:hypothetical protein
MAVMLSAPRAGRPLPPRKIPGTHFCLRLSRPQGHSAAGRIRSIEKCNDLIGNRTRDLEACSIVPQPTTLPRARPKCDPGLSAYKCSALRTHRPAVAYVTSRAAYVRLIFAEAT